MIKKESEISLKNQEISLTKGEINKEQLAADWLPQLQSWSKFDGEPGNNVLHNESILKDNNLKTH